DQKSNTMKLIKFFTVLVIGILVTSGCSNNQSNTDENQQITITGEITAVENGKDGYTATIQDDKGELYFATISIINLQKSGGEYQAHEVGDKITVTGPQWQDDDGKSHITVQKLD